VIAEAADVADEVGWDRLTLAGLADRLGVAVPSLYKHVEGLDALRREVAVASVRELGDALASAISGSTRQTAFRALADAYRGFARAHPGRYASTVRAPDPDDEDAVRASEGVLETVLGVMAGYGLQGADAIDATRAVRAALHGFVSLEAAGGFGLPQDVDRSFDRLVDLLGTALGTWRPGR
jgi:AcrR family transcriptional regulator